MYSRYKKKQRFIIHQRYIHRKRQKQIFAPAKKIVPDDTKHSNVKEPYSSSVLDCLKNKNFATSLPHLNSKVTMSVPSIFCLSKNPDESILFLKKLYSILIDLRVEHIHFSHIKCKYLGVCASTIMDIIVLECIKWRKSIGNNIKLSGDLIDNKVSLNAEVDALVKKSGLLRHLNIYNDTVPNTETLELIENGESSDVAEKSIEYINKSLSRHGYQLTRAGTNLFGNFFGEIIDNCKDHGGESVVWFTTGHYSYDNTKKLGKCKLCIVDFGDTIYESLKYHASKKMQKKITNYSKKAWYSQKSIRDEETLYNVFSLQQRVSRIVNKGSVRGNGTVTYIEAFLGLFNSSGKTSKSLFSITSGKSSILFDGTYTTKNNSYETGYSNKIIAFNKSNNLYESPDPKYVRTISNSFPGTVISMDLYIDNKHLRRSG